MVDSTLGVVVKKLQKKNYNIFKTSHRYYGSKFFFIKNNRYFTTGQRNGEKGADLGYIFLVCVFKCLHFNRQLRNNLFIT